MTYELPEIAADKLPLASKYPYKLRVEIEWPQSIEHQGCLYHRERYGINIAKGLPSCEYVREHHHRIWLQIDGTIMED
jgi:hypothetical protein